MLRSVNGGLVFIEDIMVEVVEEIEDEYDTQEQSLQQDMHLDTHKPLEIQLLDSRQ